MTSRGRRPWGSLGPHGNYAEGMSVLINDSLWGYVKTQIIGRRDYPTFIGLING